MTDPESPDEGQNEFDFSAFPSPDAGRRDPRSRAHRAFGLIPLLVLGGLSLLMVVAILLAAFRLMAFPAGRGLGERVVVSEGTGRSEEVYYTSEVTGEEAARLAEFLEAGGYFTGEGSASVQVSREGGRVVVRFVVKPGAWDDENVAEAFEELRGQLAKEVFEGALVDVHLCDDTVEAGLLKPSRFHSRRKITGPE